jgi:hypothetical protein
MIGLCLFSWLSTEAWCQSIGGIAPDEECRRVRIGVYGILGQSNDRPPKTDFKISFDIIDTWKVDWSY